MRIEVLREAGYEETMLGLSLSHNQPVEKMPKVATRLYNKDNGHNKFLESIVVWLDISAPRYWWQQFDTYRVGVTKQSESTMHTILKRPLRQDDFEGEIYPEILKRLNSLIEQREFVQLKRELPESFFQRRIVCTNYQTIRRIIVQRRTHSLPEWQVFRDAMHAQLEHQEFMVLRGSVE